MQSSFCSKTDILHQVHWQPIMLQCIKEKFTLDPLGQYMPHFPFNFFIKIRHIIHISPLVCSLPVLKEKHHTCQSD